MGSPRHADVRAAPDEPRRQRIVQRLATILPVQRLLHRPEDTRPWECDGLSVLRQLPLAVALPESEDEVRALLHACRELDVPVVARGAGTSLSGGSMPHAAGIVLSMAKFDRILAIDPLARIARVQPGVRNLAISEASAGHGLFYAPDPSSQIACSIGGNVAENSGGVHCLKYGLTVHNVLRIRGYTSLGEAIVFGSEALDSPGLDLLALVIGSEGMLAVVTEVSVRLLPSAPLARVLVASFDDVVTAGEAVAAIIAAGVIPAGLEMMDRKATMAAEAFVHAGYDVEAAAILLAESDGTPEEVADEMARMQEVLQSAGATRIRVSASEDERLLLWSGRKNAFPAAGRLSPDYYCMDGTIPRRMIGRMLAAITQMEARWALRCINVFHAGDGNLHPLILFDANDPGQWERAQRFGADILERCVELGGTITGEHGVGVEKLESMCVQFTAIERERFFAVQRAFDPVGILNPGKAIPTPARCSEYRRLPPSAGAPDRRELAADGRATASVVACDVAAANRSGPADAPVRAAADAVRAAASEGRALRLVGGGTKDFHGQILAGDRLDLGGIRGIVSFEPTELVLRVRCGTPLKEIVQMLSGHGQMLAFEPPAFGPAATIGGVVASGLSGPRRASAGAARDFVLGATLMDARGQLLRFGGQVMKNVAGYDVSRALCGSLGMLGPIIDVSLKVLPRPRREASVRLALAHADVIEWLNRRHGEALPVSATSWHAGEARLRFSGAPAAVDAAVARLASEHGAVRIDDDEAERGWHDLREHRDPFFSDATADVPLWRLSLPSTAPWPRLAGRWWIEWAGALRWLRSDADPALIRAECERLGGSAMLFRGGDRSAGVFHPLSEVSRRIHRELKQAFDPSGIFNPGRMFPTL